MVIGATALGNNADLTAGGAAVFSGVVTGEYLNFLCRIDVGHPDAGATSPCACGGSAVSGDHGVLLAGAVHVIAAIREREVEVAECRTGADTRQERTHEQRIAAIQFL